jgi:hypothetical protein
MPEMDKSHDFASKQFAKNPFCLIKRSTNERRTTHLLKWEFAEPFEMRRAYETNFIGTVHDKHRVPLAQITSHRSSPPRKFPHRAYSRDAFNPTMVRLRKKRRERRRRFYQRHRRFFPRSMFVAVTPSKNDDQSVVLGNLDRSWIVRYLVNFASWTNSELANLHPKLFYGSDEFAFRNSFRQRSTLANWIYLVFVNAENINMKVMPLHFFHHVRPPP